jgi:MoaA/NifB/PqqE/SkfB family radical SAM enzyme
MINYLKHLLFKKQIKKPIYLIYHVTYKCNAKCKMCFLWEDLNQDRGQELNREEIERISRSLDELLCVALGGGEPFLREDIVEICEIFTRNNRPRTISIPTNCLLPEQIHAKTRQILERCPTRVAVGLSLDGFESTHDLIRGIPGNYRKVLQTQRLLAPLRREFPDFSLGFLTTVMDLNLPEIIRLYDFVHQNLDVDWHTVEMIRGPYRDIVKPISLEQYESLMPKIQEMTRRYSFGHGLRARMIRAVKEENVPTIHEILKRKTQVIPCLAGITSGVIDPYGNVRLCEHLEQVGGLRGADFDFERVWFSPGAARQRGFIRDKGCWCTHCIFQNTNILFNLRKSIGIFRKLISS